MGWDNIALGKTAKPSQQPRDAFHFAFCSQYFAVCSLIQTRREDAAGGSAFPALAAIWNHCKLQNTDCKMQNEKGVTGQARVEIPGYGPCDFRRVGPVLP